MNDVPFILRRLSESLASYARRGFHLPPAYTAEIANLLAALAALSGAQQADAGNASANVIYVDFINRRTPPHGGDAA